MNKLYLKVIKNINNILFNINYNLVCKYTIYKCIFAY